MRYLLLFVAFLLLYYFAAFDGYYGYDDITYARYAAQVAKGTFGSNADHFSFRWGIIYPTGWLYKCLGIGDISTCLPTLLYTLLTLTGIYFATKRMGLWAATAAMALFSLDYYTLYFSHKLFADVAVTTFGFLALLFTALARYPNNTAIKNALLGVAMAVCLWGGFVSKETIYFLVPFLTYVFGVDIWQKQHRTFWSAAVVSGLLWAGIYAVYMQLSFGDIAYRFKAIEASSGSAGSCSYHLLPISHLIHRLTLGLMQLWIGTGMAIAMLFAPLSVDNNWRKIYQLKNTETYYYTAFGVLFLSFYYLSISFKHYIPMCLDGRHYLMLIPFAAVASGKGLVRFCKTAYGCQYLLPTLLGITIYAYLNQIGAMLYLYVLLLIWAIFRALVKLLTTKSLLNEQIIDEQSNLNKNTTQKQFLPTKNSLSNQNIIIKQNNTTTKWLNGDYLQTKNSFINEKAVGIVFFIAFIGILLLHPLYVFMRPAYNGQHNAKQLVEQHLSNATQTAPAIVITDGIQQGVGEFYRGFDTTKIRFVAYSQVPNVVFRDADSVYLLVNNFSNNTVINNSRAALPDYALHPSAQLNLVGEIGIARLYHINKNYLQQQNEKAKQKNQTPQKEKEQNEGVFF